MLLEYSTPCHLDLLNPGTDVLETSTVIEALYRPWMPRFKLHHTRSSNVKRQISLAIALVPIDLAIPDNGTLSQLAKYTKDFGLSIPCIHMLSVA